LASTLHIVQVKSANGANPAQRDTLRSLGLRGIGSTTDRPDHPALRGMLRTVGHLIEVSGSAASKGASGG
jgi:large subunit ribosomal protein L30